jgi:Fe-S-cluster containining protein
MSEHPIMWFSNKNVLPEIKARADALDNYVPDRIDTYRARTAPLMPGVVRKLENIRQSRQTARQKIRALYEIADLMVASTSDLVACKRGCSHCCHCAVAVSKQEAALMAESVGRTPADAPAKNDYSHVKWGYHNPCPFLRDGACSIYESRPLVCRTLFNVDVDDLLCQLQPTLDNQSMMPQIDLRYLHETLVFVVGRGGLHMADIRDWFPRDDVGGGVKS